MNEDFNNGFIYDFFTGEDVFIVGSGGSLYGFDYSRLNGRRVIAVNHAYKFCLHDLLVHYDRGFLDEAGFGTGIHQHPSYVLSGKDVGVRGMERVGLFKRAYRVTERIEDGLFMSDSINDGKQPIKPSSSVLPAINAALIGGAKRVFLLGCDGRYLSKFEIMAAWMENGNPMETLPPQPEFMHHCSQESTGHRRVHADEESLFKTAAQGFKIYQDFPVFNLSPFSIIELPKVNMSEVI